MKRLLLILATLAAAVMASAQSYSGAMNIIDRDATITNRGVAAVENVASETPGLQLMIEQSIQTNLKPGDLQVVQKIVLPKGCKYLNSGLDRKKLPFQHYTTAKGGETAYVLKSKTTGKTVTIKDKCLNPIQVRVPAVPLKQTIMETTWNVTEIDISISINNNVSSSATATASTAPINITFYNVTQGAPLMVAAQQSPFIMTRDSRGLLSLGYTIGGQTKIYNSNVSTNTNNNNNCNNNVNNNANSNTNVNGNTTVVNTGSGSASGSTAGSGNSGSSAGR